jgi:hypothetical protein
LSLSGVFLWLVRDSNFSRHTYLYTPLWAKTRLNARTAASAFAFEHFDGQLNTVHEAQRSAQRSFESLAVF